MKAPKITLDRCEQIIDLSEFTGVDLTYERAIKEAIAQAIIDRMRERTAEGKAFGGGKLKSPYSKAYAESLEFKAAGKKKNKITMELTGDMMAAIDVISVEGNKIKVAITDETEILKAYNHNKGDTVPARPFFGVTKGEVDSIVTDFVSNLDQAAISPGQSDAENAAILKLIDQYGGGDGG